MNPKRLDRMPLPGEQVHRFDHVAKSWHPAIVLGYAYAKGGLLNAKSRVRDRSVLMPQPVELHDLCYIDCGPFECGVVPVVTELQLCGGQLCLEVAEPAATKNTRNTHKTPLRGSQAAKRADSQDGARGLFD